MLNKSRSSSLSTGFAFVLLICNCLCWVGRVCADTTYTVQVENLWLSETHAPLPNSPHFSWFGGGAHNAQVSFWEVGQLASPGMVQMAETGVTDMLLNEVMQELSAGNASSIIDEDHWFCPPETTAPACGRLDFQIDMETDFPLVTMVSMLGPTPDWFVGVSSLSLRENNQWIDNLVVELYTYDGGTRDANVYELFGPLTDPPEPISLITKESGQIITPQLIGRITFSRNFLIGDINCDGFVSLLDVAPFVILLTKGDFQAEADINQDGVVDLLDVQPFVDLLTG